MAYSNEFLKGLYKDLLMMRLTEKRLYELYAEGRIPGHIHSGMGQEASFTGILNTRKKGDYFKQTHRPASTCLLVGTPLEVFFGEILAKKSGNSGGRGGILHVGRLQEGMLGFSGVLGCDEAVPVGAALTIQMEGRDNIAYAFSGDGASNRGPVAEAMELAAAWQLPVLFCCENNGFAISTPFESVYRTKNSLADRAAGYGMPSEVADGTDVLDVYEKASKMVEYVRSGKGPAVIECRDYRWRGHFEGDQCAYRDAKVTEEHIKNGDSVKNFEKKLLADGVLTEEEAEKMKADYSEKLEAVIKEAEAQPEMTSDEVLDGLYA